MVSRRHFTLLVLALVPGAAQARRRARHCSKTRDQIRQLTDRLRRPYRAAPGERIKSRLRRLKKLYYKDCR